jgi:hypothetical protein
VAEPWASILQSAVVAAVVSALLYLLLVPARVWREETARRDAEIRRRIAAALKRLRLRLRKEILTRKRAKFGQVPRGEFLGRGDLYRLAWEVVSPLDDPDLDPRVRARLKTHLESLFGAWRVEYLRDVVAAPVLDDPNLGWAAFVAGQTHAGQQTPFDKAVREGERSPEEVEDLLRGVDEAMRLLGFRR